MVVFGGDENVGVERGNFLAPSFRMWVAVLMHYRWHGFIEERQLVILNVDNLKLCVLAALQDIEHPLCHGRGFPPWSRTANDDSDFQHLPLSPFCARLPSLGKTISLHQDRCAVTLSRFIVLMGMFCILS